MGGEERYSMPFFFSPDEDARVGVLPHLRQEREGEGHREEWGVGEYFQMRLGIDRRTHLDGKEEGEEECP